MQVMSEAAVIFPTSGAFIDHAARFVDPSLAFALGKNKTLLRYTLVLHLLTNSNRCLRVVCLPHNSGSRGGHLPAGFDILD